MSDLDKKLIDIIAATNRESDATNRYDMAGLIERIKQAFEDEGYRQNLADGLTGWALKRDTEFGVLPKDIKQALDFAGYMTGQEWYDRWLEEFKNRQNRLDIEGTVKRAAGLSE